MTNKSCLSVASLARWTDLSYLPAAMPARIKIIVMTIIISISENPAAQKPRSEDVFCRDLFWEPKAVMSKDFIHALPVGVFRPINRRRLGLRINVEDVASAPAGRV